MRSKQIVIHFKNLEWGIIIPSILLTLLGLLSIYSSSPPSNFLNFYKQLAFFLLGIIFMIGLSFFDYRVFKNNPYLILFLYFVFILFLGGLLLLSSGNRGVRSWYTVGIISFDPTEFTKVVLIILLAKYFSLRHIEMYKLRHILLSGFYAFFPAFLVYLQPDLGSALIFGILWLGILLVSGIKLRHFLILILIGIILVVLSWNFILKDYQKERIISFIKPDYKPLEIGWNQRQAKIAIGNGGLFGQGLNKGSQTQYGFLPEPQTDFIFSAIAEEFGFTTILSLFFLYLYLIWRIIRLGLLAKDNFSRFFCAGIAILFIAQFFINIGANLGYLPVIGVPLLLISYGGSSLVATYIGLGILQSIKTRLPKTK